MREYIIKRSISMFATFLGVIILNFMIPRVMPGSPITYLMGDVRLPPVVRQSLTARFGMDRPVWEQFVIYLINVFRGDFGISFQYYPRTVMSLVLERLPWTLLLLTTSTILSTLVGIYFGVIGAWNHGKKTDIAIQVSGLTLWSIPTFWLGMVLLYIFGYMLDAFPIGGATSVMSSTRGALEYAGDVLWHAVLPMLTLTLVSYAGDALIMRGTMLEVLSEDYILTAEAKGLGTNRVMWRHAARNAMLPMVTIAALNLSSTVGGAVFTETVFAYPGVGLLVFNAIQGRDYPLLQGAFFIIAVTTIIGNFLADLIYARLDPRIKF
jgi:peptide/nickel transport system permease protein